MTQPYFHIYTATLQPATNFTDENGERPIRSGFKPAQLLMCHCCWRKRRAVNVQVQCFYDGMYCWCAPAKGCKDPKVLAAKARREFKNRSAGQKARWAKASP